MKIKVLFLLVLLPILAFTQEKVTISGYLKDETSGDDLIGANVILEENSSYGAATNVYGFYSLSIPKGKHTINYSYIGYRKKSITVTITNDTTINMELLSESEALEEVVIKGEKENNNVANAEMNMVKIDPKEVEKIPVIMGEKDIMKTVQLLPGIKSAGEGASGFFVRGGGTDQNLILLDEAIVYNPTHLLGFFSTFNSNAIRDVKLYKGAGPAQYGGRTSSILDIKMKEGSMREYNVDGSIGLISAKASVDGPIAKDKASFFVSGRRTYADLFLKLSNDSTQNQSILYFYDINAKVNWKISDKDRLYLSGYYGKDVFGFADDFRFNWGNATGTLRWNHVFGPKVFSNTSLIVSNYQYRIQVPDVGLKIGSSIDNYNLKQDYIFYANNKHTLRFGFNLLYHRFKPGENKSDDGVNVPTLDNQNALETGVYIGDDWKITPRIQVNYGVRFTTFTQFGPGELYTFTESGNLIDTNVYDNWEPVQTYWGIEPRLSARFMINEKNSFKTGYSYSKQYLHLLSNSTSSFPTDIWMPSTKNLVPQSTHQVSVGYFRNFYNNKFEMSIEAYYKDMANVKDYRTGASVNFNPTVEGEILNGTGRAYGLEFMFKKRTGKFTGWVSYTLSRTERKFEEINGNTWFPSKQDRTHDVSVVLMYDITPRINISANWVYYTGNAVTFPSGLYFVDQTPQLLYTERNGYRMPDYHRMDLGATFKGKEFKEKKDPETGEVKTVKKKFLSSWTISIYNVYARENAYTIQFEPSEDNPNVFQAKQLALFKIIPSLTWNFKF